MADEKTVEKADEIAVETTAAPEASERDYESEIAKMTAEIERLKKATTNASADASRYKKELQARMNEQERAEAERAEHEQAREARIKELESRERISNYRAKLLGTGYDESTANEMAQSLPEGITDDFFDKQKTFIENYKKTIEAELISKQPGLTAGTPPMKTAEEQITANMRRWAGLPDK